MGTKVVFLYFDKMTRVLQNGYGFVSSHVTESFLHCSTVATVLQ